MAPRCRITPSSIARQLRQEANFGCARCGCPVLENAHIIPYHITHEFPVKDMVALCPTCHTIADKGNYPESYFRQIKENPFNKIRVTEAFIIPSDELVINFGGCRFINIPIPVRLNDFDIMCIRKEGGGFLSLDVNFFDKFGRLVAIVYENRWLVETYRFWDVEYKPQHLTIRNKPRDIVLDIQIKSGEVFISGVLYYNGMPLTINKDYVRIGLLTLSNVALKNAPVAINHQV